MAGESFNERYYRLLKAYAAEHEEEQLAEAADLGRELVLEEVPPEVIGEAHTEAVGRLADESPGWSASQAVRTVAEPLMEVLMAYGMAFRGMLEERKQAEEALRESEERAHLIIETASDAFVGMDVKGHVSAWNARAEAIFGWRSDEALGRELADLIIPEQHREAHRQGLELYTETGEGPAIDNRIEITAAGRNGAEFPVELAIWAVGAGQGRTFNAFIRDISDQKRYEAQLTHAASHDPLTNLCNRRRFEEELERELARAQRSGTGGALLFMDLDEFKEVNDSLGHQAGDELLVRLAGLLKEQLRETDVVARLGGDEFAVLLTNAGADQASVVAEKLLQSVRGCRLEPPWQQVRATLSIGIATFPDPGLTADGLLSRADEAMYQAKEGGRDRFCVYTPDNDWETQLEPRPASRSRTAKAS